MFFFNGNNDKDENNNPPKIEDDSTNSAMDIDTEVDKDEVRISLSEFE